MMPKRNDPGLELLSWGICKAYSYLEDLTHVETNEATCLTCNFLEYRVSPDEQAAELLFQNTLRQVSGSTPVGIKMPPWDQINLLWFL